MVQAGSGQNRQITQHLPIHGIAISRSDETTRLLRIRVIRAVDLLKKDIFGASDPYCRIYLYRGSRSTGLVCRPVQTKTIKRTLKPCWNEEIIFRVNPLESRLVFEIYDENRLTRDDFLGCISIFLPHLEIGTEEPGRRLMAKSFALKHPCPRSRVRGSIHLYLAYLPASVNARISTVTELPAVECSVSPTPPSSSLPSETAPPSEYDVDTAGPSTDAAQTRTVISDVLSTTPVVENIADTTGPLSSGLTGDDSTSVELVTEPLPPGWDERIDQNGRTYYVDHVNRRTQWDRPSYQLPDGWEQRTDANGRVYYVDHVNHQTTWYHPLSETGRSHVTQSRSSLDAGSDSDVEGQQSEEDSVPEDADVYETNSPSPSPLVNSLGPCGSASPTLVIADARNSSRRTAQMVRRQLTMPANSRSGRPTPMLLSQRSEQSALDEVRAAQTMYLRRRPVSLEDTMSHSPPDSREPEVTRVPLSPRPEEAEPDDAPVAVNAQNGVLPLRPEQPLSPSNQEVPSPTSSVETDDVTSTAQHPGPSSDLGVIVGLSLGPDEDPLPPGWQVACTATGRRFFIDHNAKRTTWDDPRRPRPVGSSESVLKQDAQRRAVKDLGPLPPGWEERVHTNGRIVYINHNTRSTHWEDPRLERLGNPAVPYSRNYKQKYDYFRTQLRAPQNPHAKLEIRVRRAHILEDSFRIIHRIKRPECLMYHMWVEFANEKGLDYGGVRREWFFLLSHDMFNPYYGLFEYSAADNYTLQINPLSGTANEDHLKYFRFIGRVVGMAVYHGHLIDAFLIRPFYKMMLDRPIILKDMEAVDSVYYRSLKYILENDPAPLNLTFSIDEEHFGETVEVDLIPNGRQIPVTNNNKKRYIECVIDWRFSSRIKPQMAAFLDGFTDLVDLKALKIFDANELELLICGLQDVNVSDWKSHTIYKGEYHLQHPVILNFWKVVYTFPNELQSRLLQFVTGTSRVPMNGFVALWGSNGPQMFTIDYWGEVDQLPRAHTCFNRLDLPPYPTLEELRFKLITALENSELFEGVD